ncbi:hypothetical protein DBR06_SOUSAS15910010, partial [Sousa chinensis]
RKQRILQRYNPVGLLDQAFNEEGKVSYHLPQEKEFNYRHILNLLLACVTFTMAEIPLKEVASMSIQNYLSSVMHMNNFDLLFMPQKRAPSYFMSCGVVTYNTIGQYKRNYNKEWYYDPKQSPYPKKRASCQGEAQLPQAPASAPQASRPSSLFSPVSAVRTTARLTFGRAGPLTGRTQNLSAARWLRPYYNPMVLLKNKWKSKLSFNQQPGKTTNLIKIRQTTKSPFTSEGTICCPCFPTLDIRQRDKNNLPKVKQNIRKSTSYIAEGDIPQIGFTDVLIEYLLEWDLRSEKQSIVPSSDLEKTYMSKCILPGPFQIDVYFYRKPIHWL